jgi:hypothetical protein
MENKVNSDFDYNKKFSKDLNIINPNFIDILKEDIISYSYKDNSSTIKSSTRDFNENYYNNFMNNLFGNEEHLNKSLCVSPPILKTTGKISRNRNFINKYKKERRSFINSKILFKNHLRTYFDKNNKKSRFSNLNETGSKNESLMLTDNICKYVEPVNKKVKNENKKFNKNLNEKNKPNYENSVNLTNKEIYIFGKEKKKNFLCCIKC